MSKVDLGELIARASVSNLNTGREQIEYIDLDKIDQDPNNFYSLDGLDDLAANIQLCGLQQPIRVRSGESGRCLLYTSYTHTGARDRSNVSHPLVKKRGCF